VTDVTATSANLRAEINPGEAPATYRFEYLTLAAYEANAGAAKDPFTGASKAPLSGPATVKAGELTQHIAKLTPATPYRFRVVASNEAGTTTGSPRPFGTEEATNAFVLLDNRGWEMVSPTDKNGGAIQPPEEIFGGGAFQAAADGQSLTYSSADSFGAGAQGAPAGSQYVATRSTSGWATRNITAPLVSGGYGDHPDGVPYRLFSEDLARGLMLDPRRCGEECPRTYSLRDGSGAELTATTALTGLRLQGASTDLHHAVFSSTSGLYGWSGEGAFTQLSPISGAALAAPSGAISADGNRVYFTRAGNLYLREGAQSKQIDEAQGGGGVFQTASTDGRFAFFTKAGHLYRYDATSEAATDLTSGGGVEGVLGASEDGSRSYYQASTGLFLWSSGTTTEVAPGPNATAPSDYPPATGTARVSADGSHLLFLSTAELTGYENNGAMEVFLSGPPVGGGQAKLSCVSCNPTGERPRGASLISGAISNGQSETATQLYKPRSLSADGNRVFFESADDLSARDSNKDQDVYEWEAIGVGNCAREGGCVQLISSGSGEGSAHFIDASADGSDAFFLTDASLAFGDPGSFDLYDAREGGGFPPPPNTIACDGDACQPLPEAPEDPTPGTLVRGPGNPPTRFVAPPAQKSGKPHKPKKHHKKKKHHSRQGGKK
jgi:Tol biopolymer transport system component